MPTLYYTRDPGDAATTTTPGPAVVAVIPGETVPTMDRWPGGARFRYSHASAVAGVMQPLPAGSVLVEQKVAD